jgi:RNA polymerase sigma-70 factor (ECF subfamily)
MEPGKQIDPELWVDEYGDYLYRYAVSRLRDPNAAEEAVQEAFVAGVRYRDQFAGTGSERAWLLGILKRKIIDLVRSRSRFARNGSFEDQHDPSAQIFDENGRWKNGVLPAMSPDRRMQADELREVVRECLSHLPKGQADVFVLSVMEGMDSEQICRELEITPSNLWVRLHRARLGLAKCVGSKWFQDEVPIGDR